MSFMKFKTADEAAAWLKDNLVELEGGDGDKKYAIKESMDLATALEKKSADYTTNTTEKAKFQKRAKEAEEKVKQLETSLTEINTELEGLKALKPGEMEQTLQKLNEEKSKLATKLNAAEIANRELQKKADEIPGLQTQIENFRTESNRARILDEVRKVALAKKVPQEVIERDFERLVVPDFEIGEDGQIWAKGDIPKSVENYIVEQQKERSHWQPPSESAGAQPGKPNTTAPVSIAGLFETS